MPISYKDIRDERQWKASTGMSKKDFFALCRPFGQAYESIFGKSIQERQKDSTTGSTFKTYEDLLFFSLYSIKSGLTYDLLGLTFGLDPSNAQRNQEHGLSILRAALQAHGHLPKRVYKDVNEFETDWADADEVLIDGTEQHKQRPGNQQEQKDDYSGKKKPTR